MSSHLFCINTGVGFHSLHRLKGVIRVGIILPISFSSLTDCCALYVWQYTLVRKKIVYGLLYSGSEGERESSERSVLFSLLFCCCCYHVLVFAFSRSMDGGASERARRWNRKVRWSGGWQKIPSCNDKRGEFYVQCVSYLRTLNIYLRMLTLRLLAKKGQVTR